MLVNALEYPLKDKIVCVDYFRRKVKFKDHDGNIITDPEMNSISKKFLSIKDKNRELIVKNTDKLKENFDEEMGTMIELLGYRISVDQGSVGDKNDFCHDFVKQMCGKTLKE